MRDCFRSLGPCTADAYCVKTCFTLLPRTPEWGSPSWRYRRVTGCPKKYVLNHARRAHAGCTSVKGIAVTEREARRPIRRRRNRRTLGAVSTCSGRRVYRPAVVLGSKINERPSVLNRTMSKRKLTNIKRSARERACEAAAARRLVLGTKWPQYRGLVNEGNRVEGVSPITSVPSI